MFSYQEHCTAQSSTRTCIAIYYDIVIYFDISIYCDISTHRVIIFIVLTKVKEQAEAELCQARFNLGPAELAVTRKKMRAYL